MNKNVTAGIGILLIIIVGVVFFATNAIRNQSSLQTTKKQSAPGTGETLAGTTTPYYAFTKAAYEKALKEKKVILLNFYANWCPICRAEAPDVAAAFDALNNPDAVGFRVNFKDTDTDSDEEALAKQFEIPYQHTKVLLVNGKEVSKETAQWNKQQYIDAITNATNN